MHRRSRSNRTKDINSYYGDCASLVYSFIRNRRGSPFINFRPICHYPRPLFHNHLILILGRIATTPVYCINPINLASHNQPTSMWDIWPWSLWGGVYDVNSKCIVCMMNGRGTEWMNELYWVTIRDLCLSYNGPLVLSLSLSTLSFSQKKGEWVSLGK